MKYTLRAKFFYLIFFLLVSITLSLSLYLKNHFTQTLTTELLKRGVSIGENIARDSTDAYINHDYFQLESLAREHKQADADIVYILMLNRNNDVVAHSFTSGYPQELKKIKHTLKFGENSIQSINFGGTPVYDIATPVMDARIGSVRVGLSAQPVLLAVNSFVQQIITTILILGLVALVIALPLLKTMLRPITTLTHAIRRMAKGKRDQQLPVSSNDEVGLLTEAFNSMVTAISKAEERLVRHADFLQVLIDKIPLPVFYKNKQGAILGCNHAYSDFWGKSKQDIIGHSVEDIYRRPDVDLHRRKDKELIEQQVPVSYEQCVTDAKGQTRHLVFSKALFRSNETGEDIGIIEVIQDITKQRQIDQMRREFVTTVAHEFQTPLTTIMGFAELMQDNNLDQTQSREALDLIIQKAQGLSEMVNELLDLAWIESGERLKVNLQPCHFGEVLQGLVNNVTKRATNHIFKLEFPANDALVFVDRVRLGQVMENLVSNSVKYSDKQSTISIVATCSDTHCQIQVSDQGIGIPENHLKHIFKKYYRVDPSDSAPAGTGLGLYISKSIIDAHNGHMEAVSIPGKGTTVSFSLPAEKLDDTSPLASNTKKDGPEFLS